MLGSAQLCRYAKAVDWIFDTNYEDQIKDITQQAVQYDWTEAGYDAQMKAYGVSDDISQGLAHTIAGGVGTTAGYVALSLIPGGAVVTATTGALSAMGSASEMAFNCGATYEEALVVGTISAAAGAGAALNGIGGAAKGATSLVQVAGYTAAGAVVSMTEPLVNTTAQYYLYANDMVDENGNKLYDNWGDYYVASGGVLNTVIAGTVGGFSTGVQGVKGYNEVKAYASNENISIKQVKSAERNYKNNKDLFTSRKEYYDTLDYVEKNVYWEELPDGTSRKITLPVDDPGLTKCLSEKGKTTFYEQISQTTVNGKIRTNNYNTNTSGFIEHVLGVGDDYGTLGRPGDYNFGCLGSADDGINSAIQKQTSSSGFINLYEGSRGTDLTNSQRIIFTETDVDVNTVSMHSGKEQGSNSYRLAGNKLPDGSTELVYETIKIDSNNAGNVSTKIYDDAGNCLFSGSISDLKNMQKNDISKFNDIMGITKPIG